MRQTPKTKPEPARPPEAGGTGGAAKPTPARQLARAEPRSVVVSGPTPAQTVSGGETDVTEAALEADGVSWKVRVLGRSGSSETRSPPLLLLGFWAEETGGEPEREATVVARALAELSTARLEEAFAESAPPPPAAGRKPFFEGATQGRRGGS